VRFTQRSGVATWIALALPALILSPFWPALVLGVWTGVGVRHWTRPFRRITRERHRAAAVLTVLTVVLIVAPLIALALAVASDAQLLVQKTFASKEAQSLLRGLVSPGEHGELSVVELIKSQGSRAWLLFSSVSTVAARVLLNALAFAVMTYVVLADGPALYAWIERNGPLRPPVLRRFAAAFQETGRGLIFGVLGAGVIQGVAAGVIFLCLGVPRPIVLGFMTVVGSIIPSLGSALVWVPVAAGLAFTGRTTTAIILVALGLGVISTIDNLFRPLLSRRANLALPASLVFLSMLGGILLMGTWGFLAGPLVVRLCKEALLIGAEPEAPTDAMAETASGAPAEAASEATTDATIDATTEATTDATTDATPDRSAG
jgi:predicted PurR-regulated permease PerM